MVLNEGVVKECSSSDIAALASALSVGMETGLDASAVEPSMDSFVSGLRSVSLSSSRNASSRPGLVVTEGLRPVSGVVESGRPVG